MREYNVILSDGTGRITDAMDEDEVRGAYGNRITSLEESKESIERNKKVNSFEIDSAYEDYLMKMNRKYTPISMFEIKVKNAIKYVQINNRVLTMDKNFIYGIRRIIKLGKEPSAAQKERFEKIYSKITI